MSATTPVTRRHIFDIENGVDTPEMAGCGQEDASRRDVGEEQRESGSGRHGLHHHIFARSVYGSRISSLVSSMTYTKCLAHLKCSIQQRQDLHEENGPGAGSILCDAIGHRTSPVFATKFSSGALYSNMVALGDEDGYVSIVRADNTIPTSLCDDTSPHRPVGQWRTHKNAVFDLDMTDLCEIARNSF